MERNKKRKDDEYKGIFYNNEEEKKYYEYGAHFSYIALVKRLNELNREKDSIKGEVIHINLKNREEIDNSNNISRNINQYKEYESKKTSEFHIKPKYFQSSNNNKIVNTLTNDKLLHKMTINKSILPKNGLNSLPKIQLKYSLLPNNKKSKASGTLLFNKPTILSRNQITEPMHYLSNDEKKVKRNQYLFPITERKSINSKHKVIFKDISHNIIKNNIHKSPQIKSINNNKHNPFFKKY